MVNCCVCFLMFNVYISSFFGGEGGGKVQNTNCDSVQSYFPCFTHGKLSNTRSEVELAAN